MGKALVCEYRCCFFRGKALVSEWRYFFMGKALVCEFNFIIWV